MTNLRLLKFYMPECDGVPIMSSKVHLDQDLEYLPEELRYLYWHEYPLKTLPSDFELENLIELNLPYSKIKQLWEGEKEALKLMSMDLHHSQCLTNIPKPSEIPNIQILNISNCKSLSCFLTVHNLHNLSTPSLLSSLSTLVRLDLSDCALMEIPQDIRCLPSIGLLNLKGNDLKSLPASIGCLSSLHWLDLSRNNFESLPASLKQLSQLEFLFLRNCNMLQSLPELPLSLTYLYARNCKRLQSLPKVPSCLEELDTSILETISKHSGRSSYALMQMDFNFTNCLKLNEKANNFLEDSQKIFQHLAIASLRPILKKESDHTTDFSPVVSTLYLPGSKIPDWISNRSLFNSITIQLRLQCGNRNFIGFAVCVVIGAMDASYGYPYVGCNYCFEIITPFETKHVQKDCPFDFDNGMSFDSDHILFGFCPCWNVGLPDEDHHTTVSFQFSLSSFHYVDGVLALDHKLRSCGVCPVYLNPNETKPTTLTLKFAANCQVLEVLADPDEKELEPSSESN